MDFSSNEKKNILDLMIASDRELSDFLQSRPSEEELGESLDHFVRYLIKEGKYTETKKKDIRSFHIYYRSYLLDLELPIKKVCDINICEDGKILEFLDDCEYLYKTKLNESHIRGFADAYQTVESLFVQYNMATVLPRYHVTDKAVEYYQKALNTVLYSTEEFWNNKESLYSCSELLFDIVSNEQFNRSSCDEKLMGKILEYTYLILSRVILWPEGKDERFEEYDIPINYRHKISSLNKRAEILQKFKDYFRELTPSFSTPETLAVSDYALAHDYGFMGKKIGLKSLFKLDAKNLYDKLQDDSLRPYETAILDGKKDSVELAHRFYKKFKEKHYLLTGEERDFLFKIIDNVVNEKHIKSNKFDEKEIRQYLINNGIKHFYHFTERENIDNIKKNGGICSLKYCLLHAIEVKTKGDMTLLRDKDASYRLEDYARVSFCERHPLIKMRQQAGADLVILKINTDIALKLDTLFSDRDAAYDHDEGNTFEDLKKIRLSAIRKTDLEKWDEDYAYNQAEVMVKSIIPIEYIENIDDPIEVKPSESIDNGIEIDKKNLTMAIQTIAVLSDLFQNSSLLIAANDRRNEKKKQTMYSFAGILGYLFENEYCYGELQSLVEGPILENYAFTKMILSDSNNRAKALSDLANNWSGILQTILEIQHSEAENRSLFIEIQENIDLVTKIIEKISGNKCRKPTIGYAEIADPKRSQFNEDLFTGMINKAEYNPYRITAEPSLQNFPPIPDMNDTFKKELLEIYHSSETLRGHEIEIFICYVRDLIKIYYQNAGYVPKNTVDAIIEGCHVSTKGTYFRWYLPTLDEMKYKIYSMLLSQS